MRIENELLHARVEELEKALEYYAHKEHYESHFHFDTGSRVPVLIDAGDLARKALSKE